MSQNRDDYKVSLKLTKEKKIDNQYTYPKIKNHKFSLLWQCTWKNSLEGYFHIVVHVKQVQNINVRKASQVCLKEEVEKGERWYSEIFGSNNHNTLFIFSWMKFRKAFLGCYNQRCKASENEQTIFSFNLRKYIINNKNMGYLKFLLPIYFHITN